MHIWNRTRTMLLCFVVLWCAMGWALSSLDDVVTRLDRMERRDMARDRDVERRLRAIEDAPVLELDVREKKVRIKNDD